MTSVSKDEEYKYVTSQIIKHIERSVDAFKLFAQLLSAIVGGSVWLRLQIRGADVHLLPTLGCLADILVFLIALICGVMIWDNYRAWYGFRTAQSDLVPHVKMPNKKKSETSKWTMIACMLLAFVLFSWFNPFTLITTVGG